MDEYQKLENPILIELDSEFGFVIATEIDISLLSGGIIVFKGKSYNYESGELVECRDKEIHYETSQNKYFELDDNGKILD